jgi:two-component sensor histidine kinase
MDRNGEVISAAQLEQENNHLRQTLDQREAELREAQELLSRQQRTEASLLLERRRFYTLLENIPALVHLQDQHFTIRFANLNMILQFGDPTEKYCYEILFKRQKPCEDCPALQVLETNQSVVKEVGGLHGQTYQVHFYPFLDLDGSLQLLKLIIDVTAYKQIEARLQGALTEKEALLREIHHRVKNNMQVISSLLNLQKRQLQDKRLEMIFQNSQERVQAMAMIHESLYESQSLAAINLKEYLTKLAHNLMYSYLSDGDSIKLQVDIEEISLTIDQAVPSGLIINELITNALKYAFVKRRSGKIKIQGRLTGNDEVELVISDNGSGIPPDLDIHKTKTLGLKLMTGLAEKQLGGTVALTRSHGSRFTLKFKRIPIAD